MSARRVTLRIGLTALVLTSVLALVGTAGSAAGYQVQYCAQVPIVGGIPPWGFHTGQPITGATGSYARGHGQTPISLRLRESISTVATRPLTGLCTTTTNRRADDCNGLRT